jgi:hypothetical protein
MAISRMQNPQQLQGIGSLRQPYGLGKLVKKAFKGIKKIAKSPIGKAAMLGLGAYYAPMMWGQGAGFGGWGKGLAALRNTKLGTSMMGIPKGAPGTGSSGFLGKIGSFLNPWSGGKFSGKKLFGLGSMAAIGMPFLQKALKWGPYGEEEGEQEDWSVMPGSIANLRNQAQNYYRTATPDMAASPFMPGKQFVNPNFYAADGGRAGLLNGGEAGEAQIEQMLRAEYMKYRNKGGTMPYEQFKILVMKQAQQGQTPNQMMAAGGRMGAEEGGLMDMGGQEKDYRENGGFVPIGGEERADDVPARLSKNEFVFTADAVRAAGGGDIDAGSEVMQNVMDNLEQGGEVSEDSQGLQGGEEIMSEEIIDESNPAQGMYDNYEQLQSRVA